MKKMKRFIFVLYFPVDYFFLMKTREIFGLNLTKNKKAMNSMFLNRYALKLLK